jgi:NAD-dependent deacetylase
LLDEWSWGLKLPKIIVLTGAGLSADSGIDTYRGKGGVYRGIPSETVLSVKTLREDPDLVHAMCDDRRVELASAAPNAAHLMVAELAGAYGGDFIHLTQNIDDLVERAGYHASLHVHGFLTRMRSVGNSKVLADIGYTRYWSGPETDAPAAGYRFRCPKTGSRFRPDVVLYSSFIDRDPAPLYPAAYRIMRNLTQDDLLVVIGTEGSVLPVDMWVRNAPCIKVLNNLHDAADISSENFDVYLKETAATAAEKILQIAEDHMRRFRAVP